MRSWRTCTATIIGITALVSRHSVLARSAVVAQTLRIVNKNVSPDGAVTRSAVVAEGQFPAPLISGNVGDRFFIDVVNNLSDASMHRATSIHWHGIFQRNSTEMDGAVSVTQCPIMPDHSFVYDFQPTGQAGTFWYHSHVSTQYCDGLRGPLVIYDPNDPHKHLYDIDDESTIITIADWYRNTSAMFFRDPGKNPITPDVTTINGLGRWNRSVAPSPLAIVRAQPGKRHRLRIVSTSCFPAYNFSIVGHRLMVIEADGMETIPVSVDVLQIFAAQRYSVILHADQPVGNYLIRAIPSIGNATNAGGINSAILRYDGAEDADPPKILQLDNAKAVVLKETDLHPLTNISAPGDPTPTGADISLHLGISRDPVTGDFKINNASYSPPSLPALLQILSGARSPGEVLPPESVYFLPRGKVVQVSLTGLGGHPFHLHGHNFALVRAAGSKDYNYVDPMWRDVASIGGRGDNVTFRFVTDNPGPWLLHCHIEWHLEAGMAIVFVEDTDSIREHTRPDLQWQRLCAIAEEEDLDAHLYVNASAYER